MTHASDQGILLSCATCGVAAVDVRRQFGTITSGDLLVMLSRADMAPPIASRLGRAADISTARAWMFPQ